MPRVLRRAKKTRSIRFADGQIFTILDLDIDPQTNNVTLYLKKNVGAELLIIPAIIALSGFLGWLVYGLTGVMAMVLLGGVAGVVLMREFSVSQGVIERTMPADAIIGLDNYFQLKSGNFVMCSHSYDSEGNPVLLETDDYSKMTHRLIEKDNVIKQLKGMISTLNYRISESQMSRKELSDTVAAELQKILKSTEPARTRPTVSYSPGLPPEAFMPTTSEEEGEESG